MSLAPRPARSEAARANLRGIVAMLIAVGFFAFMDTVLKLLSARYPALQVAALRGWVALPLILAWVAWRGAWARLRVRWPLHLLRGLLAILMLVLFTYGVRQLPLATTYTLFFVAPILITLLSAPILGERVPRSHAWALAGGMLGVLVALRPGMEGFVSWAGLAVLGSAACYALAAVVARLSSRTDANESLMLWIMVVVALGASLLAAPQWTPVQSQDHGLLLLLALTGFGGQLAITEAFRHGQASAIAPFEYSALAWGVGIDWLIWSAWPDAMTLLGGAVVIASGVYLLRREQAHASDERP